MVCGHAKRDLFAWIPANHRIINVSSVSKVIMVWNVNIEKVGQYHNCLNWNGKEYTIHSIVQR